MIARCSRSLFVFFVLFLAAAAYGQTRIIPHVTRAGGGFTTNVIIDNNSVSAADFTLTPYDNAGNALTVVQGTIDPQATATWASPDLFNGEAVSHFTVEGASINVTVAFRADSGPGSPAHVGENTVLAGRYRVYSGEWDAVFDGFAAVNMGSEAADVWVAHRAPSGEIVQSARAIASLGPMAKGLYVIGDPSGSVFTPVAGSYFEIYSTQALAITSLRGTVGGAPTAFLWANEAQAVSETTTKRDEQGVWFIEGGSFYDVFESMGYNIATDRLWQAETYRRQGAGRMSELLGSSFVFNDSLARTTGYSNEELDNYFANLDSESKTMIQAYVDGFNRRIAEVHSDPTLMPIEFAALGIAQIDQWTHRDVMAWTAFLLKNFDPHGFAIGQIYNAAFFQVLLQQAGGDFATAEAMFNDFNPINDPDAQSMIDGAAGKNFLPQTGMLAPLRTDVDFVELADKFNTSFTEHIRALESVNARVKMGSYAWVVSGDKTASGNPIIYSGPQMGFSTPSIVVEGSIRGGGIEASGMSVPGVPSLIIARTPHHAWSMQVGHAHTADLYFESPTATQGAPHRVEVIRVAGGSDINLPIYRTSHGPVISSVIGYPIPIAYKYAHWGKEFNFSQHVLKLLRAQSMDEFGEGIRNIPVSQHFCYADKDGNIAYWMSGHDPMRPAGEYRVPQGALAGIPVGEYDINDLKPLAHDRNTARGYYGGWNNKASASYNNAPYGGGFNYGPFHRAHVVDDWLSVNDNLTFAEVRDLAVNIATTDSVDNGGNPWAFLGDAFKAAVAANSNSARDAAIAIMDAWDGHFVDGGPTNWVNGTDRADGWILMDQWLRRVIQLTFHDELPPAALSQGWGSYYAPATNILIRALNQSTISVNYDWFRNNANSSAPQTSDAIIVQALDDVLAALGAQPWGEGQRGTINYVHPVLGQTIWTTPYSARSTYAHIVEFDETGPIHIESMFPLGASGMIYTTQQLHPMFLSLTPFFDNFQPRVFPLFN